MFRQKYSEAVRDELTFVFPSETLCATLFGEALFGEASVGFKQSFAIFCSAQHAG